MAKGSWTKDIDNARFAYKAAPAGEDVVPTLTQALWGGGTDALKNGKFGEAISALSEYLRLKPSDAAAYTALGRAYMQSGERSDALNAFLKALQLNPGQLDAQELMRGLR